MPTAAQVAASRPKPEDPLQSHVSWYVGQGYRIISQTDAAAQLVKPKQFSIVWFLIWAILLIGWILYLIYYIAKKDTTVYLTVVDGRVQAA